MTWIAVAAGGAIGSMARHALNLIVARWAGNAVPYATAFVNLTGCSVIGLLAGLIAAGGLRIAPGTRTFLFVGILGGFTTFSSFALDTLALTYEERIGTAIVNAVVQVGLGILAAFGGYILGQHAARLG